jgi:hypothetical protein
MVDRLSPIDQSYKPPQPSRQTAANPKTPPLARMVDRLSPIDQSYKPPQPSRQTAANPKTPPLARMVDRLSSIDQRHKPPQPARQTAANPRPLRWRVEVELLGTIALPWKTPGSGKNNTTLKAIARSIATLAGKHKTAQSFEQKFVRSKLSQGMLKHSTQGYRDAGYAPLSERIAAEAMPRPTPFPEL